jgi:hypothetical protein
MFNYLSYQQGQTLNLLPCEFESNHFFFQGSVVVNSHLSGMMDIHILQSHSIMREIVMYQTPLPFEVWSAIEHFSDTSELPYLSEKHSWCNLKCSETDRHMLLVVYAEATTIVGYAWVLDRQDLYISQILVSPAHRLSGICAMIIRELQHLALVDRKRLTLRTSGPLIQMYAKFGFRMNCEQLGLMIYSASH